MTATPYKAMEFKKNDVLTTELMAQAQNNLQWIHDNTPRGRYYVSSSSSRDSRVMIVAGRAIIRRNLKRETGSATIKFGNQFDPACRPHVTTGIQAEFTNKLFCVVNGLGGTDYPTANGFQVVGNVGIEKKKHDKIKKHFYIHWHAFGYRKDDMRDL